MRSRVAISALSRSDKAEFLAGVVISKTLHASWVSAPRTAVAFHSRLRRLAAPTSYAFAVRRVDSGRLVGYVDITNIVRGNFLSGYISYYAFSGHERQGFMTEGLRLVIGHAFRTLKLHRLEANIQPDNVASIALV